MTLEIKTADELADAVLEARWTARRADRRDDVFQRILRTFIEREGPVAVSEIGEAFPDRAHGAMFDAVARLDEKDLIVVREGRVEFAYPFAGVPTPFAVILRGGRRRYACCAIDALGVAAMLRERIDIRSRCHDCREPLGFSVDEAGPARDARGIMVWVGKRDEGARRLCTSL